MTARRERILSCLAGQLPDALLPLACESSWEPFACREEVWREAALPAGSSFNLYLHVPFCARRCSYCMYSSAVLRSEDELGAYRDETLAALDRFREILGHLSVASVYLGGGTPTLLAPGDLGALLARVNRFTCCEDAGRTVEFHPAHCSLDHLRVLADHGVDRVSCGVQSFDSEILHRHGRDAPDPRQFEELLGFAVATFPCVNVDLMVGLDGQSAAGVIADVERLVAMGVHEICCYTYIRRGTIAGDGHLTRHLRIAPTLRQRHGARFRIAENAFLVTLRDRTTRAQRSGSIHDVDGIHTLGLGRFAGSRITGVAEYVELAGGIDLRRYPPDHERWRFVIQRLLEAYEVDRAAFARSFGGDLARHVEAERAVDPAIFAWTPSALVLRDRERALEGIVAVLPEEYCARAVANLESCHAAPVLVSVAGAELERFCAGLLGAAQSSLTPGLLRLEDGRLVLPLCRRDGSELVVTVQPAGTSRCFVAAGNVELSYTGSATSAELETLRRMARALGRYRLADVIAFLRERGETRSR